MDRVRSVNGVPIRLTGERWRHIIESHNYLAGYYDQVLATVERPDCVIAGYGGALIDQGHSSPTLFGCSLQGAEPQRWLCPFSLFYGSVQPKETRMAQAVTERSLDQFLAQAGMLVKWPKYPVWVDYDAEADVLYLSFEHPQDATNSRMRDDGVLVHYRGRKLVGVTIFEASKRH